MYTLITYYLITLFMMSIMLALPMYLSKLMKKWSNKNSSFECGMSLCSSPRKPFSMRFFLLMVLFIIFDIEIALIVAIPVLIPWSMSTMSFFMMFMIILTNGIMYEWTDGSLNWKT